MVVAAPRRGQSLFSAADDSRYQADERPCSRATASRWRSAGVTPVHPATQAGSPPETHPCSGSSYGCSI